MELDPAELSTAERYKLVIGCVTPRPIAFVSTISADGRSNLAPYSFFNAAAATPMTMMFCPGTTAEGRDKDTLSNVAPVTEGGVGQFVINLAVEGYARQMAATAEALPAGESEFTLAGFTEAACSRVRPPRVAESPVSFECETTHVIRLAEEPPHGNIVIGRVVHIWIRSDLLNDRMHVDEAALATIGRMGGRGYCRTQQRFDLAPDRSSLDAPAPFDNDVGAKRCRGSDL